MAVSPARLLDTRVPAGQATPVAGLGEAVVQVAGRAGVPADGASAVVVNVTVVDPLAAGYLTAYPSDATPPLASNVNFAARQTVPNLAVVKMGADGRIRVKNGSTSFVHVVVDVSGYFVGGVPTDAGAFVSAVPTRILDTREGLGGSSRVAGNGGVVSLQVTGRGGVPSTGVSAVVLNVTETNAQAAGYVTVHPTGSVVPNASNLNFVAGQTVPNLVIVQVGRDGKIDLRNFSAQPVDLVADLAGYFLG